MIDILDTELDHNNPKDVAVFAGGVLHLLGPNEVGRDLVRHARVGRDLVRHARVVQGRIPLASHLQKPSTAAGSHILRLPYTKTKGSQRRGHHAMSPTRRVHDPIHAVEAHLKTNDVPADMPLFSHRDHRGGLLCLTRKKFLRRCNEIWGPHGFPTCTGHSFRIGGMTELLLAGVNPDVVQAMGR
ncbi:hypothetical protein DFH09DRAFT_1323724 [Mycena vulgaris]|nr:hypothetical protein DFH09DRAFT_1323724 [Mycena vulgaris]